MVLGLIDVFELLPGMTGTAMCDGVPSPTPNILACCLLAIVVKLLCYLLLLLFFIGFLLLLYIDT